MSYTHNLEVQEAQYIVIDIFPVEVELDGLSLGDANKLILTDNRVYIIQDTPIGPQVYFEDGAGYSTFDRPSLKEYTIDTEQGHHIAFRRAKHCACGSRLRGVYPFIGVPFAAQKPIKSKG